jgi:hypothetical protein
MRVQYTLPGLIPAETLPVESEVGSLFRARLTVAVTPRGLDWKNLLLLDRLPTSASSIGPPPSLEPAEARDAAAERIEWGQVLDRQIGSLAGKSEPEDAAGKANRRAVERMLTLLMRFRELEDEMTSRHLSEPEGR